MNLTFRSYLSLCSLAFLLALIPEQYMPHMDAFLYVTQHQTLPDNEEINPPSQTASNDSGPSSDIPVEADASTNTEPFFAISQAQNYVNVRSEPNTDSTIVGKLYGGSVAEVQGLAGPEQDWFQIHSGSVDGYIKAEFFLAGEEAAAVMDEYVTSYAQITVDRLNVRKDATTDSKRIGYLEDNERVKVLEDLGDWLKVEYTDTTNGYIAKEYALLQESYQYATTAEEEDARKELWQERSSRVQTTEVSKPQNTTPVVFPTTTYTSNEELRSAIITTAMQYVGNKYVHGGNSLETGTDCSGFTMLVYAQYGYSLSRTPSGQLSSAGRSIDYSEIQPGDIICYTENGTKCSHVAIYIGDGQIVHAANSRKGICIGRADYNTIIGIKNVID